MKLLYALAALTGLTVYGMAAGYFIGQAFDTYMGTHVQLFIMFYGFLGLGKVYDSGNIDLDNLPPFSEIISNRLIGLFIQPIVLMPSAWGAYRLFPELVGNFLTLTGYTGSLYSLAFWGSIVLGIATLIVSIPLDVWYYWYYHHRERQKLPKLLRGLF